MVSSIWIKDTRCLCKAQLNSHTSAFLVLEGMQLRWVWCCCWTMNMHSFYFFVVMTLWNGAWGLFLQFPHIFCCPYPSTVKVDLGRHFDFSFYEGRVLLLVRIQIHYLLALWSILQCIAAIRNTYIMVDPAGQNRHAFPETFVFI